MLIMKKKKNEKQKQTVLVFKERGGKPGGGKGILIGQDKTFTLSLSVNDMICYKSGKEGNT